MRDNDRLQPKTTDTATQQTQQNNERIQAANHSYSVAFSFC